MKEENRLKRQGEIEQAAYALLREDGYGNISMLKVAKRAKASNETLYRWYGDKLGLFGALVAKNAEEAKRLLNAALAEKSDPQQVLEALGPVLLGILLSPQAIALNQAAASDASGELGQALADAGRETILPMLVKVLATAYGEEASSAAELYLRLLVGDLQIRRVIGQMPAPDRAFIEARAQEALDLYLTLQNKQMG